MIKLDKDYYTLTDEEIDVVINTLNGIKRERRQNEMQAILTEVKAVLDKAYDKGYRVYYEDNVIYSDEIGIGE